VADSTARPLPSRRADRWHPSAHPHRRAADLRGGESRAHTATA